MKRTDNFLKVQKLRADAVIPRRASAGSAGYDLYLPSNVEWVHLQHGEPTICKLGIAVAIPPGHYGRVAPRSGMAVKYGVDVLAGVIDVDYRGELGVILICHHQKYISIQIPNDMAIAQLIIEKISTPEVQEVQSLDDTERGAGGFGSTDRV